MSSFDPRRLAKPARRLTLLAAFGGAVYLGSRFGVHDMPDGACSPVASLAPGAKLLVDGRPRPLQSGDTVLLRVEGGTHLVARVERVRAGDAALWCTSDGANCPGFESDEHGWVPPNVVAGRVLFGWGGNR